MTTANELADTFPEINPSNYGQDEVDALNAWGIDAFQMLKSQAQEIERSKSAVRTLKQLGYTDCGGDLWKPQIGKKPDFDLIDTIRAENQRLTTELDAIHAQPVVWWKEFGKEDIALIAKPEQAT
jgi:hypothetical protein